MKSRVRQQACCAREVQLQRADEDLDGCWRDAERQVQCMAGGKGDKAVYSGANSHILMPLPIPDAPGPECSLESICEDLASLRK